MRSQYLSSCRWLLGGIFALLTACAWSDQSLPLIPVAGEVGTSGHFLNRHETLLADSLQALQQGHLDEALHDIEALLVIQPDFRLAQLIRGDLLLAHAQALDTLGNVKKPSAQLDDLRAEARARLDSVLQPPPQDNVPDVILQLANEISHIIVVDTSKSRLYVFLNQNGLPHYVADFYVSIGKNGTVKSQEGDQRTPLGVYTLTGRLQGNALSATYGPQAFPLNFPNDWDKREHSSGHGIWLHGTYSGTYSRPPHASDGCVVLNNNDLNTLAHYLVPENTPIIITDSIHWVSPQSVLQNRKEVLQQIDQWQQDWQSLDFARYLDHYSTLFTADQTDYATWVANKRRVSASKQWIKVDLDQMSLYEYPGQPSLYMVDFEQRYHSNNRNDQMHKHLYWTEQGGQWKIVAENGA